MSVASLVLGILAVVLMLPFPPVGVVCGLVGLPMGFVAWRRRRREGNGAALAGWILSLVAVTVEAGLLIAIIIVAVV